MRLPNVVKIARDPDREVVEVHRLLLLVLGCAVQCEKKEEFIDNIKQLDLTTQHAIVLHIREITDNAENVFYAPWSSLTEVPQEQVEDVSSTVISHLKKLIAERDGYFTLLTEYVHEIAAYQQSSAGGATINHPASPGSPVKKAPPGGPNSESGVADKNHHIGVELADCKSKLRRLRQEVEEKSETIVELKEELAEKTHIVAKTRQDNLELTQVRSKCLSLAKTICLGRSVALKFHPRPEVSNGALKTKHSLLAYFFSHPSFFQHSIAKPFIQYTGGESGAILSRRVGHIA